MAYTGPYMMATRPKPSDIGTKFEMVCRTTPVGERKRNPTLYTTMGDAINSLPPGDWDFRIVDTKDNCVCIGSTHKENA